MKYLTRKIGYKMVVMLLILAFVSFFTVTAITVASSDGEEKSICITYLQGLKDGRTDGVCFWRGYCLEKRLNQHHYNDVQRLAYPDGYIFGYILGKWALWPPW